MSGEKLKTIAFDLDTKALQEYYPKNDWHSAYNDIGVFLGKQGFIHSQGSIYDSTTPFSDESLGKLIEKMNGEFSWLAYCVKSIRGYDQPVMIDYTQQLKDNTTQDLTLTNSKSKNTDSIKIRKRR